MVVYNFPWGNLSQRNKIQNVRFFKQHPLCCRLVPSLGRKIAVSKGRKCFQNPLKIKHKSFNECVNFSVVNAGLKILGQF